MRRAPAMLLALAVAAAAQEDPSVSSYKSGVEKFFAHDFRGAIPHLEECERLRPELWQPHFYHALCLAQIALQTEDPRARRESLKEAQRRAELMVKWANVGYTSPATLYLEGLIAHIGDNHPLAYEKLNSAIRAPESAYKPFAAVELRENVRTAYGLACKSLATVMIVHGNFQRADNLLYEADGYLPKDHPGRADLEQNRAGADEAMNKYDSAIERLRKCIGMRPTKREEFLASIAVIHLKNERLEKGLEVLAEAADSRHPDILAIHCYAARVRAKRDPESADMASALKLYRETIRELPEDRVYRLVMELAELVLDKVGPAQATAERPLLEETAALVHRQVELRPECPPGYWNLSRLYRLLGDAEKEAKFAQLHDRKTAEFQKGKDRYDQFGRARC